MINDMHVSETSGLAPVEALASTVALEKTSSEHESAHDLSNLREMLLLVHGDFALFQPGAVCESCVSVAA